MKYLLSKCIFNLVFMPNIVWIRAIWNILQKILMLLSSLATIFNLICFWIVSFNHFCELKRSPTISLLHMSEWNKGFICYFSFFFLSFINNLVIFFFLILLNFFFFKLRLNHSVFNKARLFFLFNFFLNGYAFRFPSLDFIF